MSEHNKGFCMDSTLHPLVLTSLQLDCKINLVLDQLLSTAKYSQKTRTMTPSDLLLSSLKEQGYLHNQRNFLMASPENHKKGQTLCILYVDFGSGQLLPILRFKKTGSNQLLRIFVRGVGSSLILKNTQKKYTR